MHEDRYGLTISTASAPAAAAYREAVDLLLSAWPGAAASLDRAIAADPGFAMAVIARARVHQIQVQIAEARAGAARAHELGAGATPRERRHIEILACVIEGRPAEALSAAVTHLDAFPRDALVMSLTLGAFGLYAFSGRVDHDAARVALCEKHARHYGRDWWFLTYLGWSHTEAGNPGAGRGLAELALDLRPANGNGAHALSHALIELGANVEGRAHLADWLPGYDRTGALHGHLSWHRALLALDAGDAAEALAIYADAIAPGAAKSPPLNVFTDATSLLWRAALCGVALPPGIWTDVVAYAERMFPRAGIPFADVHHAVMAAATDDQAALRRRRTELETLLAEDKLPPGLVVPDLNRAFAAFSQGDDGETIRILERLQAELPRIGGSHAQRELCEDTLIVACLRSGAHATARRLLASRLKRRPSRRDQIWLRSATS